MKVCTFALLLVALAASTYAVNSSWGVRNGTRLAYDYVYQKATAGVYSSLQYNYPKSGQMNTRIITGVFVVDLMPNNTGATASLWSGGPGYTFVSLNFKGQYGKAINSTVEVYGN